MLTMRPRFRASVMATTVAAGLVLGATWPGSDGTGAAIRTDLEPRPSHHGLYRAEVVGTGGPIRVGRPADWTVRVSSGAGLPPKQMEVAATLWLLDAGGTGRRLTVEPVPGTGRFRVRGVQVDGPGWWSLKLDLRSNQGADSLAFNLIVHDPTPDRERWSPTELESLRSLWIGSLPPLPADPSNRYADDPAAAAFGHRLFFESRLSSTGAVSCATCHRPDREFQDDVPLAVGVGRVDRRTMPIAGTAYSPFLFWDGRKDSQWAQALGPLESPVEHGGTRSLYAHVVAEHHRAEYEAVFGPMPDLTGVPRAAGPVDDPAARAAWDVLSPDQRDEVTGVFVNIGKAMAAYERRLQFGPSRFDRYVEALLADGRPPRAVLTEDEVAGLRLFAGRAGCLDCHNGPLLTNQEFHNTGVPAVRGLPRDRGRADGTPSVLADEFNCRGRWSDADPASCSELEFMIADGPELVRAFKVPTLRNVADRPPYMHAGQIATLDRAVAHYDRAPRAPAGRTELHRLRLTARERAQLVAFLHALSGGTDAPAELLAPPRP